MELIDVLDQDGNKTGETLRRSEIHRLGKWHKVVHVWIKNGTGDLLLQKRSMNKESDPGKWDVSAGGHITAGDESLHTAQKEIQEELGISIPKENIIFLGSLKAQNTQRNGRFINNEINDIYVVSTNAKTEDMIIQKEEVDEVKFVPIQEIQKRLDAYDQSMSRHDEEYAMLFEYLNK